ncbi:MAG: hypothetical protein QOI38_3030 [Sphingomonadales bacterium]|jgi:hypothetical protein|nr:hypothetical protein [Sphingomonadales bacterium]
MKRLRAILLGAALTSAPAAAQDGRVLAAQAHDQTGREPLVDPVRTHAYAICLADRHWGAHLLAELPHSRGESAILAGLRYGATTCQPSNRALTVGSRFIRGGAAEFLLEHPQRRFRLRPFAMPTNAALQELDANVRASVIFIQIGECAARANPAGVVALLAAEVGSPEERAALANVVPAIGGCVPSGLSFQMPPLQIRAYLAEGAFRNAQADRARTAR